MVRCDYFEKNVCRSCSEIRVDYGEQLRRKDDHGRTTLGRLGEQAAACDWTPAVPSETAGFRNRAKMVVTGTADAPLLGILGDDLGGVDLTGCLLCAPAILESFPPIVEFIGRAKIPPYDVRGRRGELKFVLVTLGENGGLMVRFVLRTDEAVVRIRKQLGWFLERLPHARVVSVNLQPLPSAIVEGETELVLTEESALRMSLRGRPILLPPGGFFQTNTGVAEQLYAMASDWVRGVALTEVLDLYCGVGGFALHAGEALGRQPRGSAGRRAGPGGVGSLAPGGSRVRGVELHSAAVGCANESAALWGLEDVRFDVGDATELAFGPNNAPDLVIVNPPRRGIGVRLCKVLEPSSVGHVLYSSCNVDSLVRDIRALPSFALERASVLDMFPHTTHFEVLVLLVRR